MGAVQGGAEALEMGFLMETLNTQRDQSYIRTMAY